MSAKMINHLSIEDIILSHDSRGISALRPYLPSSYCEEAARFILDKSRANDRTAIITTGFFILSAQAPETDGPPGAIALAHALDSIGFNTVYVTDKYSVPLLSLDDVRQDRIIEFPITDHETSQEFARDLLANVKPAILISIERCGFASRRKYLNMWGKDISDYTAKVDYLFFNQENIVSIGDGGNEIGMGNLAQHIRTLPSLPSDPALTPATKLVIASISNWGGYGLVTALSQLCQRNLLPSVEWEKKMLRELVARGAVDGYSGERKCAVDNFDTEQNAWALSQLNQLLQREGITQPVITNLS